MEVPPPSSPEQGPNHPALQPLYAQPRNENPEDPVDDPKFTTLKQEATRLLYACIGMTTLSVIVNIFYLIEEYQYECTTYYEPVKDLKRLVTSIVYTLIGWELVFVGFLGYTLYVYKSRRYKNTVLLVILMLSAVGHMILFVIWAPTSAPQAIDKGRGCKVFAVFCFIVVPPTIIVNLAAFTVQFLFRKHIKKVCPGMLNDTRIPSWNPNQPRAYPPGGYSPGAYPPGAYPPGAYPPGAYPPGAYPPGAYPSGVNPPTNPPYPAVPTKQP